VSDVWLEGEATKGVTMQYTCPSCGMIGVHPSDLPPPKCHECDFKVTMKPSSHRMLEAAEGMSEVLNRTWPVMKGETMFQVRYVITDATDLQFVLDDEQRGELDVREQLPAFLRVSYGHKIMTDGSVLFKDEALTIVSMLTGLTPSDVALRGYVFIKMPEAKITVSLRGQEG